LIGFFYCIVFCLAKPIPENFQFESESGYWYDPISGFYYDKESGYYYVLEENSWKFWSSKYQTYIPCEGIDDSRRRLFDDDHHDDYSRKDDDPYLVHETRSSLKSYSPPINSKKEVIYVLICFFFGFYVLYSKLALFEFVKRVGFIIQ
jgi:hypothetical protein